ncbi:ornithine carbamoyltransferase [Bartonella fuyuanensis]|uniref:Ornithine carbamoyltransferase n=1 Tax=Bartonella fuyuanensis TaxID=1460968 RepID=A0A840DWT0_9HYPH|nr:ornithine carbamoyltransferase [Bartonella fuyuanensis]
MTKFTRHFIDLSNLMPEVTRAIIDYPKILKATFRAGKGSKVFMGNTFAMICEKLSTRTCISFNIGMHQLGEKQSSSRM